MRGGLCPPLALSLFRLASLVENGFVKRTLELINEMQADGVIYHYAIGGAVAATFYLEPADFGRGCVRLIS